MASVAFKCTLITPLFMSGADQTSQELRVPSLKGAIMFWWRAIHPEPDPQKLRDKEVEVFGGMNSENKTYRSSIRIQIDYNQDDWNNHLSHNFRKEYSLPYQNHPLLYLLFGVTDRPFLKPGFSFDVVIKSRTKSHLDSATQAFQLLSVYGGIGAKSRNGYGNFVIEGKAIDTQSILKSSQNQIKYTALSKDVVLFETPRKDFSSARKALEEIASAYKYSKVALGKVSSDAKEYIAYSGKNNETKRKFNISRHAKTHFLSIQPTEKGYKGSILFIPYLFLGKDPDDDIIQEYKGAISEFNEELTSIDNPNQLERIP